MYFTMGNGGGSVATNMGGVGGGGMSDTHVHTPLQTTSDLSDKVTSTNGPLDVWSHRDVLSPLWLDSASRPTDDDEGVLSLEYEDDDGGGLSLEYDGDSLLETSEGGEGSGIWQELFATHGEAGQGGSSAAPHDPYEAMHGASDSVRDSSNGGIARSRVAPTPAQATRQIGPVTGTDEKGFYYVAKPRQGADIRIYKEDFLKLKGQGLSRPVAAKQLGLTEHAFRECKKAFEIEWGNLSHPNRAVLKRARDAALLKK